MARVLVADDEPAERDVLARGLIARGHQVATAADGAEALVALAAARYDLLIADIVMPVMDGIALALMATSSHPDLKIVLVTGYAAELARARNLEALAQRVVSKPYAIADIARLADELVGPPGAA
ncbi:MAG: response regulator [Alphaproteobacteria bacterium]